jgi:hypothetical protein
MWMHRQCKQTKGISNAGLLPHRAAQEEGDYAHAFWQCVQCGQALGALGALCCTAPLTEGVNVLYEEMIDRLEAALQAVCADFKPDTLCRVCFVARAPIICDPN